MKKVSREIKDLRSGCLDVTSIDYDWRDNEIGAAWDVVYPEGWTDERSLDEIAPMMNYYYPLPEDIFKYDMTPEEAQTILDKGYCCLTVVSVGDNYALALTGGGMNLAWQICEGFMRLGQLPPVHFVRGLPRMADSWDARKKWVYAGCMASLKARQAEINRDIERHQELKAWYHNFKKERKERESS